MPALAGPRWPRARPTRLSQTPPTGMCASPRGRNHASDWRTRLGRYGRAGEGQGRGERTGEFLVASAEPGNRSAPRLPSDGAPAAYQALVRECRNQAGGAVSRLLGRARVTGRSGTGRGFQPAMVRAQARACVVSVTAGTAGAARPRPRTRRAARRRHGSRRPLPR